MSMEDQLNKFKEAYPSVRVTQYDDCLVYSVAPSYGKRAAERAMTLIEELKLPLIAEPKKSFPYDCFIIKPKN